MTLQLVTSNGSFGPHNTITDEGDYYLADGMHYPKNVVGTGAITPYVEPPEVALERERASGRAHAQSQYQNEFEKQRRDSNALNTDQTTIALCFLISEIRAFQANQTISTPAIDKLVEAWGSTKEQAITTVLDKYESEIVDLVSIFADYEKAINDLP